MSEVVKVRLYMNYCGIRFIGPFCTGKINLGYPLVFLTHAVTRFLPTFWHNQCSGAEDVYQGFSYKSQHGGYTADLRRG